MARTRGMFQSSHRSMWRNNLRSLLGRALGLYRSVRIGPQMRAMMSRVPILDYVRARILRASQRLTATTVARVVDVANVVDSSLTLGEQFRVCEIAVGERLQRLGQLSDRC